MTYNLKDETVLMRNKFENWSDVPDKALLGVVWKNYIKGKDWHWSYTPNSWLDSRLQGNKEDIEGVSWLKRERYWLEYVYNYLRMLWKRRTGMQFIRYGNDVPASIWIWLLIYTIMGIIGIPIIIWNILWGRTQAVKYGTTSTEACDWLLRELRKQTRGSKYSNAFKELFCTKVRMKDTCGMSYQSELTYRNIDVRWSKIISRYPHPLLCGSEWGYQINKDIILYGYGEYHGNIKGLTPWDPTKEKKQKLSTQDRYYQLIQSWTMERVPIGKESKKDYTKMSSKHRKLLRKKTMYKLTSAVALWDKGRKKTRTSKRKSHRGVGSGPPGW